MQTFAVIKADDMGALLLSGPLSNVNVNGGFAAAAFRRIKQRAVDDGAAGGCPRCGRFASGGQSLVKQLPEQFFDPAGAEFGHRDIERRALVQQGARGIQEFPGVGFVVPYVQRSGEDPGQALGLFRFVRCQLVLPALEGGLGNDAKQQAAAFVGSAAHTVDAGALCGLGQALAHQVVERGK